MKYNFNCWHCNANFRTDAELKTYHTDYGEKQGMICPLCGGMAVAVGRPSIIGGKSDNGIARDTKFMEV
jgi:Zn finger protein HypA/HybF involved in hydrogenase expression